MFKTKLCDLLNIEYPIIQGGMAWVATAELAAAVSNAGGLGIIGAGHAPADWVRDNIRKVKAACDKPFGVNVMLLSPHVQEVMQVIIDEKVPVVTTGAGNPGIYMSALKEAGCKVIPVIPSVALAQRLEKLGVDAIIAEGTESGGHVGELTTMALVPQVVDAVNIPVIAAGGIADGRGLIAAIALGAIGVQMGTRFMVAKECTVHPNVKAAVIKAKDRDAVVTGRATGHPVRCLKNKLTKLFAELESKGAPAEAYEEAGVGAMRIAMVEGNVQNGSVMSGQIAGMVKKEETCTEIMQDIMQGAEKVIKNLGVY
jgi:enoyl-[acyl-carrier protein] reductase II